MLAFPRALLACLGWCALALPGRAQNPPVLFHGGRIVLNDEKHTTAEALLAANGKVVATGTLAVLSSRPDARGAVLEDLRGATAVPGLQDAHGDLQAFATSLSAVDLRDTTSYEDLIARVKARAEREKEGTWIRGFGWDETRWNTTDYPHHFLLSTAVPKHPVYLERAGGGVVLVNTAALQIAKLDDVFEPELRVQGGRLALDESKHASGILLDTAAQLVERCIPDADLQARVRALLDAQAILLSRGITCVHDMGTTRSTLTLLEELRRTGKLVVRVVAYLDLKGEIKADTLVGLPKAPDPLDLLSVPGVRIVVDGSLPSRGAALVDDYADAPAERGRLAVSEEEFNARLAAIARAGLQPAVEAIGDRANRMVLDAFARMNVAVPGFRDLRPRVEHALVVAPKDWPRFPELGVIPSMQPARAASDLEWVTERLGLERTRGAYAWRALAPELGRLAFGSDFPIGDPDPLRGLFAARTRHTLEVETQPSGMDQRLDGAAAVAGFTSGAAFAAFQDDRRGRLEPGFACDMTVLSLDPTTCEPETLLGATCLATVVNGSIVWRAR